MSYPPYDTITITVEREFGTISITEPHGTITEFLELVRKLALAMGYHPDTFDEGILDVADDIREQIRKDNADADATPIVSRCEFCWQVCDFPSAYCSDECKNKHEWQRSGTTVWTATNFPPANEPST